MQLALSVRDYVSEKNCMHSDKNEQLKGKMFGCTFVELKNVTLFCCYQLLLPTIYRNTFSSLK